MKLTGEREAFEDYARICLGSLGRNAEPGVDDYYANAYTEQAWHCWQARAALASYPTAAPVEQQEPYAWHYWNAGGASTYHRGPSRMLDANMEVAALYPKTHHIVTLYSHPPAQDRVRPDVYAAAACYARCIISMVGDLGKRQDAEVLAKIQDAVVHAIETFYPPAQDTQDAKDAPAKPVAWRVDFKGGGMILGTGLAEAQRYAKKDATITYLYDAPTQDEQDWRTGFSVGIEAAAKLCDAQEALYRVKHIKPETWHVHALADDIRALADLLTVQGAA